ncbi:MAG: hypothetical protein ACYTEZ_06140 [Planctomycetota bacterium]|jgi:anti-sigma factor RsiW
MHDDATLWKLLDGELPAAEAEAIEAAAATDATLRQRLEQLKTMKRAVLEGAPKPPPNFAARTTARATRLEPAPVIDLGDARRFLRRALVAAAVLAAVGLTILAVEVVPEVLRPEPMQADPLLRR